ncbi:nuclease-related domain-containing protein [Rheinheimera sp. MMS21-TC3]|uniref:nuclease-related domain-containing protein n=1 Tax=Rheinheimera sp. MMS21-TC3 TaxID=3072790 RepID=UPI0028C4F7E4|nr:NERD domain-containing protein [Rheinheimera sp. MMS21-TC3]WNO62104.1 NERD domain-containing protein [Rheinheimera sp. MMS21-TC3]
MRYLLLVLSLLLFLSSQVYSQQQYTEGACIMLQQQIDRFSNQKQNSNYRNASREYEKYCRNPVSFLSHPAVTNEQAVTKKPEPAIKKIQTETKADVKTKTELVAEAELTSEASTESNAEPINKKETVLEHKEPALSAESQASVENVETKLAKPTTKGQASVAEPIVEVETTSPQSLSTEDRVSSLMSASFPELLDKAINNIPLIIANIFAFLLTIFLLTTWLGLNLPGFKGVFAEYKLNRILRWRLSREYQHFRKLKLRTAKDELVIVDHLVLSPYGIFVITVKGERGRISGEPNKANWTRQYLGRTKHLMNPLHQNFKSVEAVKLLLQLQGVEEAKTVHSVAAFSRIAKFESDISINITFLDTVPIFIKQFVEPCLTEEQLSRFAAQLKQASADH